MAAKPPKTSQHKVKPGRGKDEGVQRPMEGQERCIQCQKPLSSQSALFVEVEVGRAFCSERCIMEHFSTEVDRLESEYLRRVMPDDLNAEEREDLSHLRWMVMENPHEVWREKTLDGDFRHTLISQFDYNGQVIWCVCLTLFLDTGPSFIFLSFVSRQSELVEQYRRGELVGELAAKDKDFGIQVAGRSSVVLSEKEARALSHEPTDRLAEPWTEDEIFRARLAYERAEDDIPHEEFDDFDDCIEPTLSEPDEVWSTVPGKGKGGDLHLYHFIRKFDDYSTDVWYVVVARETDNEEEIEIMDAFPTIDRDLVDRYRCGERESSSQTEGSRAIDKRVLH